jgi:hypothetical protein
MCVNEGPTGRIGSVAPELDGYQDKGPWCDSRLMKCGRPIFPTGLSLECIVQELH